MNFFMAMKPPTTTAQEKKVEIVKGKPVIYEPRQVREAREKLMTALIPFKPKKPMTGPLWLGVKWIFPDETKRHADGAYRSTRPDTDNLEKMLKDCMTKSGFWKDDAQVSVEHVEKRWTRGIPGIAIILEELGDK